MFRKKSINKYYILILLIILAGFIFLQQTYAAHTNNHNNNGVHKEHQVIKDHSLTTDHIEHQKGHDEVINNHHDSTADHSSDHIAGHLTAHKAPLVYHFYLTLLCIVGFLPLFYYLLNASQNGIPEKEGPWLALIMVITVIIIYAIGHLPPLFGFFDPAKVDFVAGYHEPNTIAIIKFFYKFVFGIMLMIYGILGMSKHHH